MRLIVRYIMLHKCINLYADTKNDQADYYPHKNLETYTSNIIFVMSGSLTTVQNINHYTVLNTAL